VQAVAIHNLESSLCDDRPVRSFKWQPDLEDLYRGNICYRLIKHADAKRILFLVDRSNLGRQTKLEFDKFAIPETKRKFPASTTFNI